MFEKEASWHKSCHLLFSTSKLNKARERLSRKPNKEQFLPYDDEAPACKTRRLSSYRKDDCILCGQGGHLHEVSTLATDEKLRQMITELQDSTLLPRICGVDLVAADAKYHLKWMTDLRNRYRQHLSRKQQESCEMDEERIKESQAFIELIEYIETSGENDKLMFLLSELHSLSKQSKTIKALQNNVSLFAQLYIAMQNRDADLGEFFCHEVQSFPSSLSEFGNLRLPSNKSELVKCIVQPQQAEPPTEFDCKICDGAVIVHCLPVTGVITFDGYAENVFIPHICNQSSRRVDVVWDTYVCDSLKDSTREKRGRAFAVRFLVALRSLQTGCSSCVTQ